jgi:hypothetical protein
MESHGYQGLPKGSVQVGYLGNQGLSWEVVTGAGAFGGVVNGRDARWTAAGTAALLIQMRYGAGREKCVGFRLRFERARLLSRHLIQR